MNTATDPQDRDRTPARPARALLVLGSPRSGTTLVGSYLASSPQALDLGEYGGFHVAHSVVPAVIGRFPGPLRDVYLEDLRNHARDFAEDAAAEAGDLGWYVDTTPWNLASAQTIAADLPNALFVLLVRHYAGTIQSLRRSWAAGFHWAGQGFADSARVWATMYAEVGRLPADRTVVVSYDALAARPSETLAKLETDLGGLGFDTSTLDRSRLLVSYANSGGPRATIAADDRGSVVLKPVPSFDRGAWSGDIQAQVWPVVSDVHADLLARYPGVYSSPPAPPGMARHDEVLGLIPYADQGW